MRHISLNFWQPLEFVILISIWQLFRTALLYILQSAASVKTSVCQLPSDSPEEVGLRKTSRYLECLKLDCYCSVDTFM